MPLSDFDFLLRDLAEAFGEVVVVHSGGITYQLKGRFLIDPFDVSQSPAATDLNVTQTIFYYDARSSFDPRLPGMVPPGLGDLLVARGIEYEIVKNDKDDLGENALQLLHTGRVMP